MVRHANPGGDWRDKGFFRQLASDLTEAIRTYVRYDTPNRTFKIEGEKGTETLSRREYYPRFNREAPPLEIPPAGEYLWELYLDVSSKVRRIAEGVCGPIPPSEFVAWRILTHERIRPWEYEILAAMDVAFCDELNKELEAKREARQDEMRADTKPGKGKRSPI